jgi:hypothetical protein
MCRIQLPLPTGEVATAASGEPGFNAVLPSAPEACDTMEFTVNLRALNSAVECHLHTVEVIGSNPIAPTITFVFESLAAFGISTAFDGFPPVPRSLGNLLDFATFFIAAFSLGTSAELYVLANSEPANSNRQLGSLNKVH